MSCPRPLYHSGSIFPAVLERQCDMLFKREYLVNQKQILRCAWLTIECSFRTAEGYTDYDMLRKTPAAWAVYDAYADLAEERLPGLNQLMHRLFVENAVNHVYRGFQRLTAYEDQHDLPANSVEDAFRAETGFDLNIDGLPPRHLWFPEEMALGYDL
jgi:hypothetical protein